MPGPLEKHSSFVGGETTSAEFLRMLLMDNKSGTTIM